MKVFRLALARRVARGAIVAAAAVTVALVAPASARPAQAAGSGERIVRFDSDISLASDGSLHIVEAITYDFGGNSRHGIYRFVPDHFGCEQLGVDAVCKKGFDRVTPITFTSVTADPGTPTDQSIRHEGRSVVLRIGNPKRYVTGVRTYTITYVVTGAFDERNGLDALAWNVTGQGWQVPIDDVVVHLRAPAPFATVRCAAGPQGSIPCTTDDVAGPLATLGASSLQAGQGLAFEATLPASSVAVHPPKVVRRFSLAYAFSPSGAALGGMFATLLAGGAAVLALGRRGRDRVFAGVGADVALGREGDAETKLGLFRRSPRVVEFAPPAGVRPGELGALSDERVQPRDISATIIDLAIRGHLSITETDKPGITKQTDHLLTRLEPAPTQQGASRDLNAYEAELLTRLFKTGSPVLLSSLARKFASDHRAVANLLYDDLVERGWYTKRPDRQRALGIALGVVVLAIGTVLTVGLAQAGPYALAGVPVLLAGIGLVVVGRKLAVRTATGTALAGRCAGFAEFIRSPTQAAMARFAEREDLFIQYLPFAIALGATKGWAKAFADLGQLPPPMPWFVPLAGFGGGHDAWTTIGDRVSSFSSATATTLTSSTSSGGSGGGGGGFGGGGGGSW